MQTIKFSHHYEKMPPDFRVSRLTDLQVEKIKYLAPEFLDADSRIVGGGNYPLPRSGLVIILWLESSVMNIRWQTIRRWSSEKEKYYRKYIGQLVDCEIVEGKPVPRENRKG